MENINLEKASYEESIQDFKITSESLKLQTIKDKSFNLKKLNDTHEKNPLFNDVMQAVRSAVESN